MNGGIINFVTRLHLVGCCYWIILRCTDQWILNIATYIRSKVLLFSHHTSVSQKFSYQIRFYSLHLQRPRTCKCELISTGVHKNTRTLAEDMVLCALNSITLLQSFYMCSKTPPSAWTDSLARFSGPTEMVRFLIVVLVHVMACVDRNIL
jgi:hypothetical protein